MWRLIINISTQHNHPKRLKSRMSICKNQNKKIKDDRQFYLYATPSPIPSLRVEFSSIRE